MESTQVQSRMKWRIALGKRGTAFLSPLNVTALDSRSFWWEAGRLALPGVLFQTCFSLAQFGFSRSLLWVHTRSPDFLSTNPWLSPRAWNCPRLVPKARLCCAHDAKGLRFKCMYPRLLHHTTVLRLHLSLSLPANTSGAQWLNTGKCWERSGTRQQPICLNS